MLIALTGTPGTGKSVIAEGLRSRGFHVVDLRAYAAGRGLSEPSKDGDLVDLERLGQELLGEAKGPLIVEGHLSHLLPVELTIVLRSHPDVIRDRLAARGWPQTKVQENAEAEALDVILVEALEHCADVRELDTSTLSPGEAVAIVTEIIEGREQGHRPGSTDWSEVILSWY